MIETLKGGKYEKGNLTKTFDMKKVTFPKQGSVSVKWMEQKQNRKVLVLPVTRTNVSSDVDVNETVRGAKTALMAIVPIHQVNHLCKLLSLVHSASMSRLAMYTET